MIGNYIFGLPEDDADTMQATLDLAVELNCEFANFYSAMAYPGSPLYDLAVRQGVPLPAAWTGYSQHSRDCLPLPTCHVAAAEVAALPRPGVSSLLHQPALSRNGRATVRIGGRGHIRRMTSVTLERDLLSGKMQVPPTLLPSEPVQPATGRIALTVRRVNSGIGIKE